MKVTDLMLGDWVNYSILNLNAKVFSVLGNHTIGIQFVDNNKVEAIHGLLEEVIRPIPLTEEILVKNGFEKGRDEDVTTFKYGNFFLFYYPDGTGLYSYNTQIIIHYVHTLQHLLRLVGIQKDIEL